MEQKVDRIIGKLKHYSNKNALKGMASFGIETKTALGVSIPNLRKIAKESGMDHETALLLWNTGIHEAKILASMIDDPALVTKEQMENWVMKFDSWDICDQCCGNLFDRTRFAYQKAISWTGRKEEYVKRAGFVLMAALSVHNKKMSDAEFLKFLPILERESYDERNFVKKAVNWALRQIGKRNRSLNRQAIKCAESIARKDSKSARWIANDALRELRSAAIQKRLNG